MKKSITQFCVRPGPIPITVAAASLYRMTFQYASMMCAGNGIQRSSSRCRPSHMSAWAGSTWAAGGLSPAST